MPMPEYTVKVLDQNGAELFSRAVAVTGTDLTFDIGLALRVAAPDYPENDAD